jgi:hypothetical protein
MTRELAVAINGRDGICGVHQSQLKGTRELIAAKNHSGTYKLLSVRNFDPNFRYLMDLPYDIRYAILEQMTPKQNLRAFLKRERVGLDLPIIARVGNIQLRRECLLVALNSCTMEIHSGPGSELLRAWLAKVDFTNVGTSCKTGFDAITSLNFPYFGFFPYGQPGITVNNDVGMAVACKNLRSMSIQFAARSWEAIANRCQGEDDPFELMAQMLRENYQLDGIFEAKNLQVFTVHASGSAYAIRGLGVWLHWLVDEFARRGQRTVVKVV